MRILISIPIEKSGYRNVGSEQMNKYLIKLSSKIQLLSKEKDSLIYPNLVEPLTQADYEKWGMDSLVGYENEIDKVKFQMEDKITLETGRILRRKINKNDFAVNNLNVSSGDLSLIEVDNEILTFNELGEWESTNLEELLNQLDFNEHGISDLSLIPTNRWYELDNEFEVWIFTEDTEAGKFVEITTDPFTPIEWVSKSDFEVLMWTDNMELEEPPKIEITVPPFRPLDKLDNQFSIVMGEYEPE